MDRRSAIHKKRTKLTVLAPHYNDWGTWDFWFATNRCPIVPKGNVLFSSIWPASYQNDKRRDLFIKEGETEVTLNSPTGAFGSGVEDGDDFNDWLILYAVGSGAVFQHNMIDQINQHSLLTVNGLQGYKLWQSSAIKIDSNSAPTTNQTHAGQNQISGNVRPDYVRTGDYTLVVIANNPTSGASSVAYSEGYSGLAHGVQVFIDRSANKRVIQFSKHLEIDAVFIDLPSQVDTDDVRHIVVSVISDIAYVYLNTALVGSIDITGLRNWLNWQGQSLTLFEEKDGSNLLNGNITNVRLTDLGMTADQIYKMYELDKRLFDLPEASTLVGIYDDWYIPAYEEILKLNPLSTYDDINVVLTNLGETLLTATLYQSSTEYNATLFRTRWLRTATSNVSKTGNFKTRYFRKELLADTSSYSIADVAFGGIVCSIETDVHLLIMSIREFTRQWSYSPYHDTFHGLTDDFTGAENTIAIADLSYDSASKRALAYELREL